ncbi:uncharacterized protein [Prorops nasuta]|uniref:uncharacterized protein n=1 Tax=Prorops nasuta TaxID=863751 RepID=UPI0034CF8DA5
MSKRKLRGQESETVGPMKNLPEHYLFLLEFYVEKIEGSRLGKLNQMFFVPTIVSFEFLDFRRDNAIFVSPVDPLFEPQAGIADDVEYFFSGRSVLFALEQSDVTDKLLEMVIRVMVRKRMPDGLKPDILVGIGQIDVSPHFAALRKEMLQCWHDHCPPSKVFEGCVPLVHEQGAVGSLDIFLRISAFGQTIVTEFDAPPSDQLANSYIFKKEQIGQPPLAYNCKVVDPENMDPTDTNGDSPCRVCTPAKYMCAPCGRVGAAPPSNPEKIKKSATVDAQEQQSNLRKNESFIRGKFPQACGKAVVLKVSGLLDTDSQKKRKPCVTVAPESEAVGPNNPPGPDHDVFILRIGKKGLVGANEKSDLQLEMRTPKKPELGPPVRLETREIQTDGRRRRPRKRIDQ